MVKTCYSWDKNEMKALLSEGDSQTCVVAFEDDGFLPTGVVSPYRYFCDGAVFTQKDETPLYADYVTVPDLYEIRMNYSDGLIMDEGVIKGKIEFAEPKTESWLKGVSWLTLAGKVCKKDCYDKYGKLFFSELFDDEETAVVRTYFSNQTPVLSVQPKFDTYMLMKDGRDYQFFGSKNEFHRYFMKEAFSLEESCITNEQSREIMILTNSDSLEGVTDLVKGLAEFRFHIGAKTQMSDKLHALKEYGNVILYEGLSELQRNKLLETCSYYLDINYGEEICDAKFEAFRHGILNIEISTTFHNQSFVLDQCIFDSTEVNKITRLITTLDQDHEAFNIMIQLQKKRRKV